MGITIDDLKSGRVKPEFGNIEHIQVVREAEKRIDEQGKVKKFHVTFVAYDSLEIEAKDEEEARKLASDHSPDFFDYEIEGIEEI